MLRCVAPAPFRYTKMQEMISTPELFAIGIAFVGAVLGVIGTTLGVISYRRDAPCVQVKLLWDMTAIDNDAKKHGEFGIVEIANVGRRSIFLSHASITCPLPDADYFTLHEGNRRKHHRGGRPPKKGDLRPVTVRHG